MGTGMVSADGRHCQRDIEVTESLYVCVFVRVLFRRVFCLWWGECAGTGGAAGSASADND